MKFLSFRQELIHYQTTNFRLFQTEKKFANDNLKFDENGRKLSKPVENTVGKGEIARNEQFLLFPQCFQKACLPGTLKGVVVWEWVNQGFNQPARSTLAKTRKPFFTFYCTVPGFNRPKREAF